MVVTAGDFHFFEMGLQFVNDGGNDRGILVGDFGVINIPTDGTLGALNQAVGDAMVVRVEDETHRFEGLGKEFIPQEGGLNAAVKGLDKTHVGTPFSETTKARWVGLISQRRRTESPVNFIMTKSRM
jgi:hypothetical protein